MADRAALDTAIQALETKVTNLSDLCNQLINKAATGADDFSAEIAQLGQLQQEADTALNNAKGAAQAPEVPQPGANVPTTDTSVPTGNAPTETTPSSSDTSGNAIGTNSPTDNPAPTTDTTQTP